MTATMRAARFNAEAKSLEVREVPVPKIQPHEVLVKVQACGVCLSDVHLIDGSLPGPLPEITPGHEPAGVIETVGDALADLVHRKPRHASHIECVWAQHALSGCDHHSKALDEPICL